MKSSRNLLAKMMKIDFIAKARTPFIEKFGVPRQPLIDINNQSYLEFVPPYHHADYFKELDGFSHIWVISWLDKVQKTTKTTVRPPRLGGSKKVGVFASRSPHRPNPIGLSLVKLEKLEHLHRRTLLFTSLLDLLDETPILDIKPFIHSYDLVDNFESGWPAKIEKHKFKIEFLESCLKDFEKLLPPDQNSREIIKVLENSSIW